MALAVLVSSPGESPVALPRPGVPAPSGSRVVARSTAIRAGGRPQLAACIASSPIGVDEGDDPEAEVMLLAGVAWGLPDPIGPVVGPARFRAEGMPPSAAPGSCRHLRC